jgi:predicted  nucleic acid-binding Zn-ribbon protein
VNNCKHTAGLASPEDPICPDCGKHGFHIVAEQSIDIDNFRARVKELEAEFRCLENEIHRIHQASHGCYMKVEEVSNDEYL